MSDNAAWVVDLFVDTATRDVHDSAWWVRKFTAIEAALDERDAALSALKSERDALAERVEKAEREREVLTVQLAERVIAPDRCPITGRPFFMAIDGLATYGGPYDSYTIPVRDDDGSYVWRRYDHDEGGWVEDDESFSNADVDRAEAAEAAAEKLKSDLAVQARENAELVAALKPFAAIITDNVLGPQRPDEQKFVLAEVPTPAARHAVDFDFTVGDFRRAASAIEGGGA